MMNEQRIKIKTELLTADRLYYLDWLRVLAILMVFLFHAVHPFDIAGWHIKNAEQSVLVTIFLAFLFPWGMPFFFLLAGAGSSLALRRRSAAQFIRERSKRLLIPFIAGSLLLTPIQVFFEWRQWIQNGLPDTSYLEYLFHRGTGNPPGFDPIFFGWMGLHLWFIGFLFAFSLFALPFFFWLKGETGRAFLARVAGVANRPGGLALFIFPFLAIQLALRPIFPREHDWADFFFQLAFFVFGYLLFEDQRLLQAARKSWLLLLALAASTSLVILALLAFGDPLTWIVSPAVPFFYLCWGMITVNAFCWALVVLTFGRHALNFSSRWLDYGREAVLPFFLLHQPVIVIIAYFVVQGDAGIPAKLLLVVLSSFVVTLGVYELIIKRFPALRSLVGMKPPVRQGQQLKKGMAL